PPQRGISVDIYQQIVEELNDKAGKQYRWNTPETKALIRARLNDGFSPEDFKKVIFIKSKQWLGDEKFTPYLRPKTLFGSKFEGYLQEWYSYQKKLEQQKAEYEKAKRIERGEADPEISPEDLKKQEEWRAMSKELLAKASDEDYQAFYKQLKPPFKDMAYKRGLEDNLVRNLFVQWLKEKKDTHTKTRRHEEEKDLHTN
ncbi:MAG: conserved phage C-terminal domain-containing protein, partial [Bacilli bacterium]